MSVITNGRLLDVNAYTTLDYVEAAALGHDWTDEGPAVVDVRTPEDGPGAVVLELELDGSSLDHLTPHVDRLSLTRVQARTLVDSLVGAIDRTAEHLGRRDDR